MREDITGVTFGRLTAIRPVLREGSRKHFWLCNCACGYAVFGSLRRPGINSGFRNYRDGSGHTKSCGCYRRELPRKRQLNLTGRRYGRLLVLGTIVEPDGSMLD